MNTFLIARHGETYNNQVKRLSGWIDTPLTEKGLIPADTVLKKLKPIRSTSSTPATSDGLLSLPTI
jgi:broad specificity phosphatase PhoE